MSTLLKEQICALRDYFAKGALDCALPLYNAISWYTASGEGILNNVKTLWRSTVPAELPSDLADFFEREAFSKFEPLETEHMPLTNINIARIVAEWHRKLFGVLGNFCQTETPRKVLCAFNVVDDQIFYLTSATDFERFWNALGRPVPGRPQREPDNVNDALACLIEIINDPSKHGKFYPSAAVLDHFYTAAQNARLYSDRFLGGAAGNMAYILSQMGVEVHIYCPYHSNELRWNELAPSARYLEFAPNHYRPIPADPGIRNLPHKRTIGFQTVPGWSFALLNIQAIQPGRALFIGRYPTLDPQQRSWNDAQVQWQGQNHPWNGNAPWRNREIWPHPTVLGCHDVGQILTVIPAGSALTQQLALKERYNVALLKDVGDQLGLPQLEEARKAQVEQLRQARIPIFVEISPNHNLAFLRYLISGSPYGKASYWSAGLNPDELLDITDRSAKVWDYHGRIQLDPYLFPESRTSESLLQRFVRALHLLKQLELDWIYVHGNELDIAIWRKEACGLVGQLGPNIGAKLRDGMLLAKAAVVAALITRSPNPQLRQLINNRLAQGSALAVKGFWSLLSFARQFSEWVADRYHNLNIQSNTVYQNILNEGFYEVGNEFGVAVAPVFWPDEANYLHSTGAGDYSSAVVAMYVWG
jgi:hypothetical protein